MFRFRVYAKSCNKSVHFAEKQHSNNTYTDEINVAGAVSQFLYLSPVTS